MHKVGGARWVRAVMEVSSRVVLSRSGRFPITRCGWNSCADTSSRNLFFEENKKRKILQGGADSPGVAESPLLSPGERFPQEYDCRERHWVFDTVS